MLKWYYPDFLETYEMWQQNPKDFYNSWMMIDHHPALWARVEYVDPFGARFYRDLQFDWETSGLVKSLSIAPYVTDGYHNEEPGQRFMTIEGGGHVCCLLTRNWC